MNRITKALKSHSTHLRNKVRYGGDVPYSAERIWVNPQDVKYSVRRNRPETAKYLKRSRSGLILDGDWDLNVVPVEHGPKYKACAMHFIDGLDWSETGIYQHMTERAAVLGKFDECRDLDDVVKRYAGMDDLWRSIQTHGVRPAQPVTQRRDTEPGGVFIHIGRDGQPLFGSTGNHRFAISRLIGLTLIPAQLGLVHAKAYKSGLLDHYRSRPEQMH